MQRRMKNDVENETSLLEHSGLLGFIVPGSKKDIFLIFINLQGRILLYFLVETPREVHIGY